MTNNNLKDYKNHSMNSNFDYGEIKIKGLDKKILLKSLYSMSLIRSCEFQIAKAKKTALLASLINLSPNLLLSRRHSSSPSAAQSP